MPSKKKLWEIDHPYYCTPNNYLAAGDDQPEERYSSWEAFLKERGEDDQDLNLVIRFDWFEGPEYDLPNYDGDDEAKIAQLCIFYLLQRKGHYCWAIVDVCRNDEPKIREWLEKSYKKIKELWKPFS